MRDSSSIVRVRAASTDSASKTVPLWWWRVWASPQRSIVPRTHSRMPSRPSAWMNGCGLVADVTSKTPRRLNSAAYASASRLSVAYE